MLIEKKKSISKRGWCVELRVCRLRYAIRKIENFKLRDSRVLSKNYCYSRVWDSTRLLPWPASVFRVRVIHHSHVTAFSWSTAGRERFVNNSHIPSSPSADSIFFSKHDGVCVCVCVYGFFFLIPTIFENILTCATSVIVITRVIGLNSCDVWFQIYYLRSRESKFKIRVS